MSQNTMSQNQPPPLRHRLHVLLMFLIGDLFSTIAFAGDIAMRWVTNKIHATDLPNTIAATNENVTTCFTNILKNSKNMVRWVIGRVEAHNIIGGVLTTGTNVIGWSIHKARTNQKVMNTFVMISVTAVGCILSKIRGKA